MGNGKAPLALGSLRAGLARSWARSRFPSPPLPCTLSLVAPSLNLAALTGEELERLLGVEAAQRLRPDLSRARMEGKPYQGPELPEELRFDFLEDTGAWGATSEHTRRVRSARDGLGALGFQDHGVYYAPGVMGARHLCAFTGDGDTAARIVWSETLSEHSEAPYGQLLTLLRDRAAGFAAVLTVSSAAPPVPALSEEVALRFVPGVDVPDLHAAHRSEVARHGRGVRLVTFEDWQRAWRALRALNFAAWARRGVLLGKKTEGVKGER